MKLLTNLFFILTNSFLKCLSRIFSFYNLYIAYPLVINLAIREYFHLFYENFLLVILCKYNLGVVRFGIAKCFFCGLFICCCIQSYDGALHVVDNCINFVLNGAFAEPSLPKDPHILTYNTANFTDSLKPQEPLVDSPDPNIPYTKKPYYVYTCAFLILYWGVYIAHLGG